MMRRQTRVYFSTYDPRAGMRVSSLLYRYDLAQLLSVITATQDYRGGSDTFLQFYFIIINNCISIAYTDWAAWS